MSTESVISTPLIHLLSLCTALSSEGQSVMLAAAHLDKVEVLAISCRSGASSATCRF